MSESQNKPKHSDIPPMTDDEVTHQKIIYGKMLALLNTEQVTINVAIAVSLDVIVTCILNAEQGDKKETAQGLRDYIIPEILETAKQIEDGTCAMAERNVESIKQVYRALEDGILPVLADFDITKIKAN